MQGSQGGWRGLRAHLQPASTSLQPEQRAQRGGRENVLSISSSMKGKGYAVATSVRQHKASSAKLDCYINKREFELHKKYSLSIYDPLTLWDMYLKFKKKKEAN